MRKISGDMICQECGVVATARFIRQEVKRLGLSAREEIVCPVCGKQAWRAMPKKREKEIMLKERRNRKWRKR